MVGYFSLSLCHFQSTLFIKSYPVPFLSPHPHTHTRRSVVRSFILNVSNRSASSSFCSQSNSNQLYATHPPNCLSFSASFYVTNVQCRYKYTDTPTHAIGHSRTQDSPLSLSLTLSLSLSFSLSLSLSQSASFSHFLEEDCSLLKI